MHQHDWQFEKTFIAEGKPKLMRRLVFPEISMVEGEYVCPKVEMWVDCRQEYARFICICGERKVVETK